jgi:hypothetical protein
MTAEGYKSLGKKLVENILNMELSTKQEERKESMPSPLGTGFFARGQYEK